MTSLEESVQLLEAIDDADNDRLRTVLKAIVADPNCAALVSQHLLADLKSKVVNLLDPSTIHSGSKRKRYKHCRYCKEEFDVTENEEDSCEAHTGDMDIDVDDKTWDDWNVDVFGEMDCPENKVEYPEGFIWDCCDRHAGKEGCRIGCHVADTSSSSRRRLDS